MLTSRQRILSEIFIEQLSLRRLLRRQQSSPSQRKRSKRRVRVLLQQGVKKTASDRTIKLRSLTSLGTSLPSSTGLCRSRGIYSWTPMTMMNRRRLKAKLPMLRAGMESQWMMSQLRISLSYTSSPSSPSRKKTRRARRRASARRTKRKRMSPSKKSLRRGMNKRTNHLRVKRPRNIRERSRRKTSTLYNRHSSLRVSLSCTRRRRTDTTPTRTRIEANRTTSNSPSETMQLRSLNCICTNRKYLSQQVLCTEQLGRISNTIGRLRRWIIRCTLSMSYPMSTS